MQMFCTKCGKELFDEAVICPQCGTQTKSEAPSAGLPADNIRRAPDIQAFVYNGEIGSSFAANNALCGDFYFEDERVVVEMLTNEGKVKQGSYTLMNGCFALERKKSRMLMYSLDVLVIRGTGFTFSLYAMATGILGKFVETAGTTMSSGASNSEYIVTNEKLRKIEQMLSIRTGG